MSKTLITEWLNNPHPLNDEEQQQLRQILAKYPYLVPAQWMQLATKIQSTSFDTEAKLAATLTSGNWMLLYQTITRTRSNQKSSKKETLTQLEVTSFANQLLQKTDQEQTAENNQEALETLVQPLFAEDYFQHQGIEVGDSLTGSETNSEDEKEKSLMVMMSFEDWLLFLKKKDAAKKSEEEDKAQLRAMWQREKLAAALEEEEDGIPEAVFEMAINSIDKEEIMVSESLAEIHAKQGRFEKAIEMYRKLSLQNPEKKTYFAAKINQLNKEKLS